MKIIQQLNGVSLFLPCRIIRIYYTKKPILKVLIFHSSNLKKETVCNIDKKAKEDKNFMLIFLIWNTNNKVQWVFFQKESGKPPTIQNLDHFWKKSCQRSLFDIYFKLQKQAYANTVIDFICSISCFIVIPLVLVMSCINFINTKCH